MFATPYQISNKPGQLRNKSPKSQQYRPAIKQKQELPSIKNKAQHKNQLQIKQLNKRSQYIKSMSSSPKHQDKNTHSYLIHQKNLQNQENLLRKQWNRGIQKKGIIVRQSQPIITPQLTKKPVIQTTKPQKQSTSISKTNQYKKLHDKLNYLQNKIIEMKQNIYKKRQQKKKYIYKQIILSQQLNSPLLNQHTRTDPLKQVVSQISCNKNLKPLSFDPYSPRHNTYYVSQIVRAYKQQNSLPRQHLINSIQLLKMLTRIRRPTKQEINDKIVKYPKKPIYHDKKTIIFDLDQTLIHCNENVNMPCDIKLPIKFITGEIIYAGINIRPYAIELLRELSKSFEIIIFTASHSCYANVVLNYLDPENKFISYRLFREHCYSTNQGVHVKDLRVINRDLSQTVLIDNAAYSYAFQVDNGIPIIPYYEGKVDFQLKVLQTYLQSLTFCKDVRQLNRNTFHLHRYAQFDNPQSLVKQLYATQLR